MPEPGAGHIPQAGIKNSDALTGLCHSLVKKRIQRGLKQSDVAKAIGLSTAQFSRYEKDYYANATIELVRQIMKFFGDSFD